MNGTVAFGHPGVGRSALSSLNRGLSSSCSSSSSMDADFNDKCLLFDKCSIVDGDDDDSNALRDIVVPGNQLHERCQDYHCHNDTEKC